MKNFLATVLYLVIIKYFFFSSISIKKNLKRIDINTYVSIFSLFVALLAFIKSEESGKQQQKNIDSTIVILNKQKIILDTTKHALSDIVTSMNKQRILLDSSAKYFYQSVTYQKKEWDLQLKRMAISPKFRFSINNLSEDYLENNTVKYSGGLELSIYNIGNMIAKNPVFSIEMIPPSIIARGRLKSISQSKSPFLLYMEDNDNLNMYPLYDIPTYTSKSNIITYNIFFENINQSNFSAKFIITSNDGLVNVKHEIIVKFIK